MEVSEWMNQLVSPVFALDGRGEVSLWNDKMASVTGVERVEVMGDFLDANSFVVSSDPRSPFHECLDTLESGMEDSCEHTVSVISTEQGPLTLRVKSSALRTTEGKFNGVMCICDPVVEDTNHHHNYHQTAGLEESLVVSQDGIANPVLVNGIKNQQVDESGSLHHAQHDDDLENIHAPIIRLDCNGCIVHWNQKTSRLLAYSCEEARGLKFVSFVDEPQAEETERFIQEALDGNDLPIFRVKCKARPYYLQLNLSSLYSTDGKVTGLIIVAHDVTDQELEDQKVASIAQELRLLVDGANAPIFGTDTNGIINEWNKTTEAISGFSREEAIGQPLLDKFISPSDRESVASVLSDAIGGTGTTNYDLEFRTKGGDIRLLLVNATTRLDRFGNVIGVVGVAQDVTESANHDRAIASMANELRQLIDKANAPIFGIDVDGDVNEWNDKTAEITGYSKYEAFDRSLVDTFIVESLRESVQEVMDLALQGIETSNYELEFVTKHGEIRYLLVNATTRRDAENNIVGVVGVAQDVTEAAQHDRAVAAMARELRQLVDTANAPIFGIDIYGNVNEWNDKTIEITGFSGDEAFNQPLVETFIVPKLRVSVQEVLDNALKGRGTSNYELEFRTKSNEIRYLLVNATTRRDAENNIVGVVGVAQDVTEAAKHDRAVAAMANELRQLIDTANAPIFGIDVDGDVNEWNDKTAEITGFTKEEAFDCSLVETFIVPHLRHSVQEVMDNALQGRGTSNYELEFRTKSNEIRHLLVNATTRRDAESNVVGVVGVAQDVTEAVQRDRAVAAMANELRQLIDTANAPIFGIDCDGNVNEWNNKTAEITGYLKEEAFDEPLVSTFIVPSLRKQVKEVMEKALLGDETSNYELEFVTKSGEIRYLLVNATTRRDPENQVVGVVGVAQDVTEDRKHAKELREMQYLRASQEAKVETERNMTAYFAHELRNPLGAIDSALSAMPDDLPESARSLVKGMQLCTGFMSSIMNNLLDVRKMEEGKMTLSSSPISLKDLLHGVHTMLLPSVRPGVAFIQVCDTASRDWVLGDAHRIQQVITNVVTNAIKYTISGSVTLSIRWEGKNVRFECTDSGPGIPKKEQKKLFERYVQRGGAPGTGLGLAIAKHLVDLTGGTIRFESDPTVKPGTNCIVEMPLPRCDPPEVVVKDEDLSIIEEPLTFLIIDDVKMNRTMLKRRIKKGIAPNATITEASTGEEALEICGKDFFDVIVVDQYMEEAGGVMVGTDVVFAMRRMRIKSIIIGCSGNDIDDQFAEAGADWVWKKPMPSNSRIIADIRTAWAKKQAQNANLEHSVAR